MAKKSKNSLDGEIITIQRGLAIYKVHASPFWQARVRDPRIGRYVVRSTEETSRIKAKQVAREIAFDLLGTEKRVEREYSFRYYASRLMAKGERLVSNGERNANYRLPVRPSLDIVPKNLQFCGAIIARYNDRPSDSQQWKRESLLSVQRLLGARK